MASLNSIFSIFAPKNKIFYGFFESHADKTVLMSKRLIDLILEKDLDKQTELLKQIEVMEHECDHITHTIFTELGRNFITPFDREDIHYLGSAMDDVADYIYSSAKKITTYRINAEDEGIQRLGELIQKGSEAMRDAVYALRDMKDMRMITECLVRINAVENQGDDMFDSSIDRLFAIENDVKMLIKRRELYQSMETATDKLEDVANVIESIIIKYA